MFMATCSRTNSPVNQTEIPRKEVARVVVLLKKRFGFVILLCSANGPNYSALSVDNNCYYADIGSLKAKFL